MQVDVNVNILFLCFCSVLFTPSSLILFYSQGVGGGGRGERGLEDFGCVTLKFT